MSNSTQRAALPPLPNPMAQVVTIATDDGKKARVIRALDLKWIVGADGQPLYTAEQVEQIRRETVQACADLCAAEQAENRALAKGSKTAMYDWMADGAGLCRGAILALLEGPQS